MKKRSVFPIPLHEYSFITNFAFSIMHLIQLSSGDNTLLGGKKSIWGDVWWNKLTFASSGEITQDAGRCGGESTGFDNCQNVPCVWGLLSPNIFVIWHAALESFSWCEVLWALLEACLSVFGLQHVCKWCSHAANHERYTRWEERKRRDNVPVLVLHVNLRASTSFGDVQG